MSAEVSDSDGQLGMNAGKDSGIAKFQKELLSKIPNDPSNDSIDKGDYLRYISLIKKQQIHFQKDAAMQKALSRTALQLTLNQNLITADMKNFNRKAGGDVTDISKNFSQTYKSKKDTDYEIKNENYEVIQEHFDGENDTKDIQELYSKV